MLRTVAAGTAFVFFVVALVASIAQNGSVTGGVVQAALLGLIALSVAVIPEPRRP